jgi:hypothetical protein
MNDGGAATVSTVWIVVFTVLVMVTVDSSLVKASISSTSAQIGGLHGYLRGWRCGFYSDGGGYCAWGVVAVPKGRSFVLWWRCYNACIASGKFWPGLFRSIDEGEASYANQDGSKTPVMLHLEEGSRCLKMEASRCESTLELKSDAEWWRDQEQWHDQKRRSCTANGCQAFEEERTNFGSLVEAFNAYGAVKLVHCKRSFIGDTETHDHAGSASTDAA